MKPAAVGLLIFSILLTACGDDPASWRSQPFSAQDWRAADRFQRYVFVRDLIQGNHLIGKSQSEVVAMLGSPDWESNDGLELRFPVKLVESRTNMNAFWIVHVHLDESSGSVERVVLRSD